MDIDDDAGGSRGNRKEGVLASPPQGLSLCPPPPGNHCGMGKGLGQLARGREMVSVPGRVSSASVPLWLLGVEGGREQGGEVSRLVWLPLGSCSCLGRGHWGFGGVREPRELLTSPRRNTFFLSP